MPRVHCLLNFKGARFKGPDALIIGQNVTRIDIDGLLLLIKRSDKADAARRQRATQRMSLESEHYLKKELNQRIRDGGEGLEYLLSSSLDGIWYRDLEQPEQVWISPEFWLTLGWDPISNPHPTSAWQDLMEPSDLAIAVDHFAKHCADPDNSFDQIHRYRHAGGDTVWMRCRSLVIQDESGKPVRMFCAFTDVTPAINMNAAEDKDNDQIDSGAEGDEQFVEFASIASHDLQAPLRRITSFLDLIETDLGEQAGPDTREWMRIVNENTAFMQRMINDLLDLSRVSESSLKFEPLDLNSVVQRALVNLHQVAEAWEGEMVVETLPTIIGADALITRLFQNVIHNAMIYSSPDSPQIRVSAERKGAQVLINIEDNGIGIEAKHHEQVFEVFRRLHSRQHYGGGTGMGLALSRRIMKRGYHDYRRLCRRLNTWRYKVHQYA